MIEGRDGEFADTIRTLYLEELGREPDEAGAASWLQNCRNGMTGDELRAALHASPEAVAYRNRPKPPPLPSLTIRGRDFIDANGQRQVLCGTDQFRAFRQFLDAEDLGPLFTESNRLGFNLWRVFLMGSAAQNGILELWPDARFYDQLRPFADLLNAHGITLLATAFVDAQDVMPSRPARADHWRTVADALRGTGTILSCGNEWTKNGFQPSEFNDPGMVWSRGSDVGDAAPFTPYGSVAEFHPRRDLPAAILDSVASPVTLTNRGLTVPLIADEPPRMGTDGSGADYADPEMCWRFARHYATEWAGAVFHSRSGQRGVVMDPLTEACAVRWVAGMRI